MDWFSLAGSALGTLGNMYRDKKNREFQREMNDIQMQREDTAIQRRMADYAASGINPLMVVHSNGAETGNYSLPESTTNFQQFGEDISNAILNKSRKQQQQINEEQIKQQKELTDYLNKQHSISLDMAKNQNDILKYQRLDLLRQFNQNQMEFFNSIGVPYEFNIGNEKNSFGINVKVPQSISSDSMPLTRQFQNLMSIQDANALMSLNDLLLSNKDVRWDTANRIFKSINSASSSFANFMSPFHFGWNNNTSYSDFYGHTWNESNNTSENYSYIFKK